MKHFEHTFTARKPHEIMTHDENWNDRARGAISMAMATKRINRKELMAKMDCSHPTLRKWIDRPGQMTVTNWVRLCAEVELHPVTLQVVKRNALAGHLKKLTR